MPRTTTCSGNEYCGRCIRCELLQAEGRAERAERERDRYATILELAARFAAASPETQIKDDGGGVIDGRWLASHIQDVLEGEE